ncbi:MAG: radical SAM/SPASM domain-containing protein [Candidatus Thorarchaeota archaeon]
MPDELEYLTFRGMKLVSFKKKENGEIIGTGILNPLLEKLRIIPMLYLQANFYKKYDNIGKWRGKRVANTFAPPVGSRPQFRALKGLIKSHICPIPYPVAMTFAVTYKCQCNCVHCSAGRHLKEGVPELSTEEAKQLIDDSQKLGVTIIAFTGGEPLTREDIYELIAHVDQRKAMPIMFTNGLLLNDENVERLAKAGMYSVFVSLDSPIPQEHDARRKMPGIFENAINGIKKLKEKGILVGISSYAIRSATEQKMYRKMYKLAQELGVQNYILFDGVPTGNMLKDTSEMLTPDQRDEIYRYSAEIFEKKMVPPLSSQSWQNSVEGNFAGIGCLAGNIQYYVSAYGEVAPCDFTPLSFGNIRKEPLKNIWVRMVKHPAYSHRSHFCRMQNPQFRQHYIDPIPDDAKLPYNISKLPRVDYTRKSA